ncbi:SNF2-related protein [Thermodesulfobacteriota bacterium]
MKAPKQLNLFKGSWIDTAKSQGLAWPKMERFPYNFQKNRVEHIVLNDLATSDSPLIITGFTSLDYIIDFIAGLPSDSPQSIRLLIGSDPTPSQRKSFSVKRRKHTQEIIDYWLEVGISLRLCYKIIQAMEMIKTGRLNCRFISDQKSRLHGKVYLANDSVTLGSSNFSFSGMQRQLEANVRFERSKEKKRYSEAELLSENYWSLGKNYNQDLMDLLGQLLSIVTWQEALGRACGELLEGEWAQKYIKTHMASSGRELWPSQKAGIAQALWMVENVGSVLVADATGSGKTRMGAHLLRSVMDRIWSTGRVRKDITALVCPPGSVEEAWGREACECGLPLTTLSHGVLSHRRSEKHDDVIKIIRRAQSLAIDEAHNFLNPNSSRTRGLHGNMADVVVMFTATPINKGVRDLLRIVDLLGADNLDDSALVLFERLERRMRKQSGNLVATRQERMEMQTEVQRFTLRRTKAMLNAMVDHEPEAYKDDRGEQCRYPEHRSKTYKTHENDNDKRIAQEIRELAGQMRGMVNLRSAIEIPEAMQGEIDEETYIRGRLQGAKGLALYQLMSRLRSSKAALFEHLKGTEAAAKQFSIKAHIKNEETGNVLKTLQGNDYQLEPSSLADKLPSWLTDDVEHRRAVQKELGIYNQILELVGQLSDRRELFKAKRLASLLDNHSLIIAFDSCLITLEIIRKYIQKGKKDCEVIVATGAKISNKKRVNTLFSLGSTASNVIALCSDAMSEGLNLQQASAVMLLDMPSVIRIAEQRVGRVDRMNSPHKYIQVLWPKDSEEFSLNTDRKFYQRYTEVEQILGSNLKLPENLIPEEMIGDELVTPDGMIRQMDERVRAGQTWDGLGDAFQPVRDLVNHENGLVPRDVYMQVRNSKARVLSSVSMVRSKKPWAFFAISSVDRGAPKWIFLNGLKAKPVSDLEKVAEKLKSFLAKETETYPMDEIAAKQIHEFLNRVLETEHLLLPRKKQRALKEMGFVLDYHINKSRKEKNIALLNVLEETKALLETPDNEEERPDLDAVAEAWLDLIRETWYEKLAQRKRFKPLRLKDIRKDLQKKPLEAEKIATAFDRIPMAKPIHVRVVSAIIGVPC